MPRGRQLSDDLRTTILTMARQLSTGSIASYTGIGRRTIQRVLSDYNTRGTVKRIQVRPRARGRQRSLAEEDIQFLQGSLRFRPDFYLDELRGELADRCGTDVNESTIWRVLRKSGFTMKKLTRAALERNEDTRASFRFQYGLSCNPETTIFVDESSFNRLAANRGRGWALKGQQAVRKTFFVRGRRYSLLPALSIDGMLYAKIVEGSFTKLLFMEFMEGLLDRMDTVGMPPESVIVMDNARIHKDPRITAMIEARGYRALYLPPYSPDLNPIELAFSKIKAFVRRDGMIGRMDDGDDDTYVYVHLLQAAFSITPDNARGYYHHCGYI